MAADRPAVRPLDTMKVRGRLRGVWLTLRLAAAAGSVLVGVYGDTPEPGSHAWWLPLFLFLAVVLLVLAVISFGRGLDADGNAVVVRNTLRTTPTLWRDLAAIEFKGVDSKVWNITNMYSTLVFQRHDGSEVTAEAPGGGESPGEYLFELRGRLLLMRSAALGDSHAPADRPSDAATMDASNPATPTDTLPTTATRPLILDEPWLPPAATESRIARWRDAAAAAAVAVVIALLVAVVIALLIQYLGHSQPN